MIVLKVRRVGNSAAVTLPKEALARLRVEEGDTIVLTEDPDGWRLTPYDDGFADAMRGYEEARRAHRDVFRELSR